MTELALTPHIDYLLIFAIGSALIALYFFIGLAVRLKTLRLIAATRKLTGLILFLSIAALTSLILISTRGYQALTYEQKIARVKITTNAPQAFTAQIRFSDGRNESYDLRGDEIMLEANILKWKSWAQLFGFTTAYRLDRVRGRYSNLADEKRGPQSIYSIRGTIEPDLADWRQSYNQLSLLVDVEHGSASYVSAKEDKTLELWVTRDGLLLRELDR